MAATELANHDSGTFEIAGKTVHRLGFGAMRLTGQGVWGPPRDRDECVRVVRRAVELGVDFIDTADSYGPYVSEEIIREALHPYPEQVLVATKAGLVRHGPGRLAARRPPRVPAPGGEMSLRRLGLDRIDLFQLHRIDPKVPVEDQIGELKELQDEGKIGADRPVRGLRRADRARPRKIAEIATVQNLYNLTNRQSEDVARLLRRARHRLHPVVPDRRR